MLEASLPLSNASVDVVWTNARDVYFFFLLHENGVLRRSRFASFGFDAHG